MVNYGIQYSLEGLGAASYIAQVLHGRSCTVDGVDYFIKVVDIRDADVLHEEIGIPEFLEETIFIRRDTNRAAEQLEGMIRSYVQALPESCGFPVETVPVPHLHVLLGRP